MALCVQLKTFCTTKPQCASTHRSHTSNTYTYTMVVEMVSLGLWRGLSNQERKSWAELWPHTENVSRSDYVNRLKIQVRFSDNLLKAIREITECLMHLQNLTRLAVDWFLKKQGGKREKRLQLNWRLIHPVSDLWGEHQSCAHSNWLRGTCTTLARAWRVPWMTADILWQFVKSDSHTRPQS